MVCPAAERWYDFKEGVIEGPDRDEMAGHPTQCRDCEQLLKALDDATQILDNMGRLHDMPADPDHPTIPCPSSETLTQLIDAALPETEQASIYAHLAECFRCREALMAAHLLRAAAVKADPIPTEAERRENFARARQAVPP